MANIGEICSREVVIATRETTVTEAAKLMRQHHVGSLVVVDQKNRGALPVGIVTDRDIVVEVTAMELNPAVITAGDIMGPELTTAREDEGVLETMEIMRYKGVRRLPVVDSAGKLIGIVAIDDLLEILAEEMTELVKIVAREQAHEAQARK